MKRWAALTMILAVAGTALWLAEKRKPEAAVSPAALLAMIGDSERELSRLPMRATRLSDEEEIRIGEELLKQYEPSRFSGEDRDRDAVQNYVSRVGGRVAVHAHRKLPYSFHYIPDNNLVNAFALPGGPVFIGAGLISIMDSEDQLASVLGHEVEHIDHGHCAERVQLEARTRGLGIFRALLQIPVSVFQDGYSKQQELQADAEGTRLMVLAGYSPNGAVRMFEAFDRLYQEQVTRAHTPQEELSQMALQTLSEYFRSHPPSRERAEQIRGLIESENWKITPEHDLEIGYVFWASRAELSFRGHKYELAKSQAEQALKLRPDYLRALHVLAQAQARQGDFASAAAALRQMLEREPRNLDLTFEYADALAGVPNHAKAYAEFSDWLKYPMSSRENVVAVPLAGLALLSGDTQQAEAAIDQVNGHMNEAWAADWCRQLGKWYYLAGKYERAAEVLDAAQQLRPGDSSIKARRGWNEIELRRYADALNDFGVSDDPMGRAVALWLSDEREPALSAFAPMFAAQPEWNNPRWVRAVYSPNVWRAISQMAAEHERRKSSVRTRP